MSEQKETQLFGIAVRFNPYCMHGWIMAYMDTYKVFKE